MKCSGLNWKKRIVKMGGVGMRAVWMFALLIGAIFVAGCLGGGQPAAKPAGTGITEGANAFPNATPPATPNGTSPPSPPARPAANNTTVTPPSAPVTPPANVALLWDASKALKVSLLRKGDSLAFDTLKIKLQNIRFAGKPLADYQVLDAANNMLTSFTLGQNESIRFPAPGGEEYLFVAIFNIGEGLPNAVQTQVYRTRDLSASGVTGQIGSVENSYTLSLQYPKPVMLVNQTIGIGQTISVPGSLSAELTAIDRSTRPAGVSVRVKTAAGAEIGTANLQGGQMAQITLDPEHRYYVALQTVDAVSDRAVMQIYQK